MATGITTMSTASSSADCFYFYTSTCLKGSLCPYRHEPAALRSETVCHFWLMGNCRKPNCSFRHTNIIQSRNSTPCFYENRPGGCKKVHCPFVHVAVRDQPREEDEPKSANLILPTAKGAPQGLHHGSRRAAGYSRRTPRISNKRFVITASDLDTDDDSDSDFWSYSSSSSSSSHGNRDCSGSFVQHSAEKQQELELLRNMQLEQAALVGYSFEDNDIETSPTSARQGYNLRESSFATAQWTHKPQKSSSTATPWVNKAEHNIPLPQQSRSEPRHCTSGLRQSTPGPRQNIPEPKIYSEKTGRISAQNKENVPSPQRKREGSILSGPATKKRRCSLKPVPTQACRTVRMNETNIRCTVSYATPVTRRVTGPVHSECSNDYSTSESDSREDILANILEFEIPEEYRG